MINNYLIQTGIKAQGGMIFMNQIYNLLASLS